MVKVTIKVQRVGTIRDYWHLHIILKKDIFAALFNDMWKYDIANDYWVWQSGNDSKDGYGNYGQYQIPSQMNYPGGRESGVRWQLGDELWLFGGNGYAVSGSSGTFFFFFHPSLYSC